MKFKKSFFGLSIFVLLFFLNCSRNEPVQLEAKNPFREAVKRVYGRLNMEQVKGAKLYKRYCSLCHGETGKGDGINAFNLNPRPADLTEVCKVKDDEYMIKIVIDGTRAIGKSPFCPP
ncbi:MAG: c-type cytochrome, partial [Thermodesulfobacteriota bacterium]